MSRNTLRAERLDVYLQLVDDADHRHYVGTARLDENFGLIGRRFGIKADRLLNGQIVTERGLRFWLLTALPKR
jgi:hypothetical protein